MSYAETNYTRRIKTLEAVQELQNSGNPVTPEEFDRLIAKRPESYGPFSAYGARIQAGEPAKCYCPQGWFTVGPSIPVGHVGYCPCNPESRPTFKLTATGFFGQKLTAFLHANWNEELTQALVDYPDARLEPSSRVESDCYHEELKRARQDSYVR